MFCTNCGNEVKDDISFCPECGAKIKRLRSIEGDNATKSSSDSNGNQCSEINRSVFDYQQEYKPTLGMKWHYALIVFLLISAIFLIIYETYAYNQMTSYLPSEEKSITRVVYILNLIHGVFDLYVAYTLFYLKKNGPQMIQWAFYVYIAVIAITSILGGPFAIIFGVIWIIIICLVLRYTRKYYQERETLFIN